MMANYRWIPLVTSPYTYQTILDTGLFVGYVTNEGLPYDNKKWFVSHVDANFSAKAGYANGSLYFFSLKSYAYFPMAKTTETYVDENYARNAFTGQNTGTSIYYNKRWSGSNFPYAYPGSEYFYNFASEAELFSAIDDGIWDVETKYPITYRLTNCTAPSAPTEAAVGDTVSVPVAFPDGYGIVNNENVYVTNNGVIVPSTYSDGVLTFEMPDPS